MKKTFLTILILTILSGVGVVSAQKKSKRPVNRGATGRTLSSAVTPPKIEVESWKEFKSEDLNLKLIFPKEPTESVNSYTEVGTKVKSTVIQSYINSDYYMVEVREYPDGVIPDGTDLGERYGSWLKTFILRNTKIVSEKSFAFGQYRMVEFVYQQLGNEVLIHRAMVVGNKLYQIIVQFEIKKPDTLEQTIEKNKSKTDKFFLSFELQEDQFIS